MGECLSYNSETGLLDEALGSIDNLEDFKSRYLSLLRQDGTAWQAKIAEILERGGYTPQALAKLCGVSRAAVVRWQSGSIPSKRDTFIRIGFAAGYDLDGMNKFLQRYGKYNGLYPKSLEDSVYIFVLNSDPQARSYTACQELLERLERGIRFPETVRDACQETGLLSEALLSLDTPEELEDFIWENLASSRSAFSKFYDQVLVHIRANNWDYLDPGDMQVQDRERKREWNRDRFSVSQLADTQGWSAALRRCVSEIRQRKWFPRRTTVISLGLHLNMNRRRLDELLELAHMEPLCAKTPLESAIIFAMEDAELNDLIPDPEHPDASMDLCSHVRQVLEYLDLPDGPEMIRELFVEW